MSTVRQTVAARTAGERADEAWALAPRDPQAALALAGQAVLLAEQEDDAPARARALRVRGRCLQQLGQLDEAAAALQEAAAAAAATGQLRVQIECLNGLSHVFRHLSDLASSVEVLQEALTLAEGLADPTPAAGVLLNLSAARLELGDPAGAAQQARGVLDLPIEEPRLRICAHGNLGRALHELGDHETAEAEHRRAAALAEQVGDTLLLMCARRCLAEVLLAQRRCAEAEREARAALDLAGEVGGVQDQAGLVLLLARSLEAQDRLDDAKATVLDAVARAEELGVPRDRVDAYEVLSVVLERTGDHAGSLRALRAAFEAVRAAEREETTARAQAALIRHQAAQVAAEAERLARENAALTQARHAAEELARIDPLTRVGSRRRGAEALDQLLAQQDGLGVLLVDVDRFKAVNDTFGHAAGDAVLIEVARRLRESVREQDVLVRWGGEEFLVLLPDVRSRRALLQAAERLRRAVRSTAVDLDGVQHTVTVSIGGCLLPLAAPGGATTGATTGVDPADPVDPVEAADVALYAAKNAGRDRCVIC